MLQNDKDYKMTESERLKELLEVLNKRQEVLKRLLKDLTDSLNLKDYLLVVIITLILFGLIVFIIPVINQSKDLCSLSLVLLLIKSHTFTSAL